LLDAYIAKDEEKHREKDRVLESEDEDSGNEELEEGTGETAEEIEETGEEERRSRGRDIGARA